MAITDYIPNVFGSATPTTYEGLLGMGLITPEQLAQTKSTANIQGLLGAGLALAQGMSKIGPRRSAAENILGALSGGFGAAGGAYQQGLQNIVQQQQLQSAALTQQQAANRLKAIQQAKVTYPDLAPLADIDPGRFAEEVALRERVKGVSTPEKPTTPEGFQALAEKYYSAGPNFKALGDAYMEQAKQLRFQKLSTITGKESPSELRNLANTAAAYGNKPLADQLNELASRRELEGPTAPTVPTAEVAAPEAQVVPTDGTRVLPTETVVANRGRVGQIQLRIDNINSRIAKLTDIPTSAAKDEVAKLINVRDGLQKDVERFSIMEYDFTPIEKLVPEQFKSRVRSLKNRAETGALSMAELSKEIADIENKSIEFVTKKTDFTNQDRRVFGGMFKNPDGSPRAIETASPIELMQLENKLYEMRIAEKRAGATTINMPTESERTAGFLTNRVVNSLNQLQTVVGAKPTAASPNFGAEAVKFLTGSEYLKNLANPEARQQVEAAQLEILDAALTLGTGAAYTREQLENYRRSYFPMLGDKPGTIQDKQNRLKSLIDSAMIKSGRAAPSMPSNIAPAFDLNAIQRELDRRKGK